MLCSLLSFHQADKIQRAVSYSSNKLMYFLGQTVVSQVARE